MINRKLLSTIFLLAAALLAPQGAWATLTPRGANGELYKAFIYGTTKTDFVVGGGSMDPGSVSVNGNMWDLEASGVNLTCTLSSALQAGDKIVVEVAYNTTSNNNNKGNGLKLREKDQGSETGYIFTIGDSYTTANEIVTKEYTLVTDDPSGLVGATAFTVFRNTGTNSAKPRLRSIAIIRSGSDCNMPGVLAFGNIQSWVFASVGASEDEVISSCLVKDDLFYSPKNDGSYNTSFKTKASRKAIRFGSNGGASSVLSTTYSTLMFIVPAGKGTITVNHACYNDTNKGNFMCKIGTAAAQKGLDASNGSEWTPYLFAYDVSCPTPVWIYSSSTNPTYSFVKDITVAVGGANATIGTSGYTTFTGVIPLDLSNITSTNTTKAYYAKSASGSNVTITSTEASVSAGEGLILKGTAGDEVFIAAAESGAAIDGNKMKGCIAKTAINSSTENYANFYVLSASAAEFQNIGEWCASNTLNIPAGKAYLDLTGVSLARSLSISFDEETTGIDAMHNSECIMHNEYFDLQGRKVAQPTKGLYIVNGKKVVIK